MAELTYGQVFVIGLLALAADFVLMVFIGHCMAVGRGPEPLDEYRTTDREPCVLPFTRR